MKRYLPYLFVLGLLMVSCVRDVEIDLEDLPDRIVLNGIGMSRKGGVCSSLENMVYHG